MVLTTEESVSDSVRGPQRLRCPPSLYTVGIRDFLLRVKRLWRKPEHSPLTNAEVKNAWIYTSTPLYVFMEWYLSTGTILPLTYLLLWLLSTLSHINLIHTFLSPSLKIHFNIILPSTLRSSKLSFPVKLSDEKSVCTSRHSYSFYMPHLIHSPWFCDSNILWRVYIMCRGV
jgi:hypothetical protein